MKKIWDFFENLSEYVYVADIDTHELVYMNKKARETYGFHSPEEYVGKKCYNILQNCSEPCAICTNGDLKSGYFKEWEYYNPILDKYLMLKDTLIEDGDRKYRLEIALDASVQQRQGSMLRSYENLETIVNEGFRIALQESSPDRTIQVALEYLGKALNGERTYIFEKNEKGGDDNTYEWVANGVTPEKENLQDLPSEVCADWYQSFRENKNVVIEDIESIREENPLQYEKLAGQNIHSLVVVPLYDEKDVIGFYGVDNPPEEFFDYAMNMLQIMGYFIVSSLKRRDLVKQLQVMSYHDQLTGLGNRHLMNEYLDNMQHGEHIGIVYCDITGLKRVNDTEGHAQGDKLIVRASQSLKRVFGDYGVFRIGGDELLALCMQIDRELLMERVGLLQKDMEENAVNIAVGAIWEEEVREDIDKLLARAESLMYKDKAAYYKASGLDRRR
ncbi:MAG: diguanylate cyclase [Roseburia sp.]|nr:diguanylate cyclase [Roseburia sp.]